MPGRVVRLRGTPDEIARARPAIAACAKRLRDAVGEEERFTRTFAGDDLVLAHARLALTFAYADRARQELSTRADARWWSDRATALSGVELLELGRRAIAREAEDRVFAARDREGRAPDDSYLPALHGAPADVRHAEQVVRRLVAEMRKLVDAGAVDPRAHAATLEFVSTHVAAEWWSRVGSTRSAKQLLAAGAAVVEHDGR